MSILGRITTEEESSEGNPLGDGKRGSDKNLDKLLSAKRGPDDGRRRNQTQLKVNEVTILGDDDTPAFGG